MTKKSQVISDFHTWPCRCGTPCRPWRRTWAGTPLPPWPLASLSLLSLTSAFPPLSVRQLNYHFSCTFSLCSCIHHFLQNYHLNHWIPSVKAFEDPFPSITFHKFSDIAVESCSGVIADPFCENLPTPPASAESQRTSLCLAAFQCLPSRHPHLPAAGHHSAPSAITIPPVSNGIHNFSQTRIFFSVIGSCGKRGGWLPRERSGQTAQAAGGSVFANTARCVFAQDKTARRPMWPFGKSGLRKFRKSAHV